MTKVREKLLECYVRFDPVVRVFLTSRCVLYSVVLTAWAGYGKTGALVNRRGEILQGQMTISNIHEIFFLYGYVLLPQNSNLIIQIPPEKHFSKQVHCRTRTMKGTRIHFSEFFCIKFQNFRQKLKIYQFSNNYLF